MFARIRRQQRREAMGRITFQPVDWQPQVQVKFTRDVSGWLSYDHRIKWSFSAGQTAYVDEQHAVEFIVKGYAVGRLPRHVSDDEQADIRSAITVIGLGAHDATNNGGG